MKKNIKSETNKNVTRDAANQLGKIVEEEAERISEQALQLAEEDGRKTVTKQDIQEALKQLGLKVIR